MNKEQRKKAALAKAEERLRKRERGLVPVQEWVHVEDAPKLKLYATKLRSAREMSQP